MEIHIPKKGEIYRHFKGNLYEIIVIARDSETLEEKVVYQSLDGKDAYVRPLSMFVSKVDRMKYPDAEQEYRFQLVEEFSESSETPSESCVCKDNNMIMEYLDQETTEDKIIYLQGVKDKITEEFLEVVAQSLDFILNTEDLDSQYREIMNYLSTLEKYEGRRFR